eukprot:TRINITY_DN70489_c0_g1_i1.p1 TRINITY_DN70489_c0_g1~~TRINITY_DN70489_c0_g1_i1.p1  ORF type:complete len:632 (+),score=260.41 TRINITY_DN70489_c0_g1_i1:72-1898(+)
MAGRRVPMLDSYMPPPEAHRPSSRQVTPQRALVVAAPGAYDAARELEVRKQLERFQKRRGRASARTAGASGVSDDLSSLLPPGSPRRSGSGAAQRVPRRHQALVERARRWDAERDACTSDLEYWQARAAYCEDIVRLMQEHVEAPLRQALQEEEARSETLQAQLNIVARQADERARALAAAESRVHAEAEGRRQDAEEARRERQSLDKIETLLEHLQRSGDNKVDHLSHQLERILNVSAELEQSQRSLLTTPRADVSPASPPRSARRLAEELAELERTRSRELQQRDSRIAQLEQQLAFNSSNPSRIEGDEDGLARAWDLLWQLLHDTDRQRSGLRTALAQMEMQAAVDLPAHRPRASAELRHRLRQADFARLPAPQRVEQLATLIDVVVDEAGHERADSIAALRRVLEQHHELLAQKGEREQSLSQQHQLDLQRLAEVERDRDEERQLYQRERERLQQEEEALRQRYGAAAGSPAAPSHLQDAHSQTEAVLADTWAQTQMTQTSEADVADPQQLLRELRVRQELISDLTRSVEHRDARIRRLEEHRALFMHFVYGEGIGPSKAGGRAPPRDEDGDPRQSPPGRNASGATTPVPGFGGAFSVHTLHMP